MAVSFVVHANSVRMRRITHHQEPSIVTCPNDCILYRGEYENLDSCPVCNACRYKIPRDDPGDVEGLRVKKRVAAKVMWYFPLIPRLKYLFMNKTNARFIRWHKEERK